MDRETIPPAPVPQHMETDPEPIAHVFPDDLQKLLTTECSVTAYSVPMGDPDRGETVPLVLAAQAPRSESQRQEIPMPKTSEEAELMAKAGLEWLEASDPTNLIRDQLLLQFLLNTLDTNFLPVLEQPTVPDVDALAQHIRKINSPSLLGAGAMAEKIVEWLEVQQ